MDLEERIAELLEEWGYAFASEIGNELAVSTEHVLRILESDNRYKVDKYGEWSIR